MQKSDLRAKYKTLRKEFSPADLEAVSARVFKHLQTEFDLEQKEISVFVPLTRFNEINTWHIVDTVNAQFSLPVIGEDDELKHIRYEGKHQLKISSFGVLEPQFGAEVEPAVFDIVLVPLLTIDSKGFRVGYGKGYYDKFLAKCRPGCLFIGLYQFDSLEQIDDLYPSDIALHYCVTPNGVLNFTR